MLIITHVLPLSCQRKKNSIIYLILTVAVASKFTRLESIWLQSVEKILQKKVYKTRITYLHEPKQRLRTKRAKLDHIIVVAAIRQ